MFLVKTPTTGTYFIQNSQPFFYGFTKEEHAVRFCNSHPDTELEELELTDEEEWEYTINRLYQLGYKGYYLDEVFHSINQTNPMLMKLIPEQASLLQLILYRETKNWNLLKNQRFYFFAKVTEDGYLSFANTNGTIFAFTDIDNMDTTLAKTLYKMGYEVIRYYMNEKHTYLINARKATQLLIGG